MRVLVIEDDHNVSRLLRDRLERRGHVVDDVDDGKEGLRKARQEQYDVMIIDRVLPGLEGLSIIKALREAGNPTPILVLSALGEVDDRVRGLRSGGDDYLVKPFATSELIARIEALARRPSIGASGSDLEVADLKMDLMRGTVFRGGRRIRLKPREFRLLEYLMRHASQIVTRDMILEGVWSYHFNPKTNIVDVHISTLRRKLDEGFGESLIHTVRGTGYVLGKDQ